QSSGTDLVGRARPGDAPVVGPRGGRSMEGLATRRCTGDRPQHLRGRMCNSFDGGLSQSRQCVGDRCVLREAVEASPIFSRPLRSGSDDRGDSLIGVENIRKRFGTTTAVDGASFNAADGSVTGLLGPNGAGKTTSLRMIYGLMKADSGSIIVDGHNVRSDPQS